MRKIISRISTRGYYDLKYGKTIKKNSYFLYPKKDFEKFIGSKELVIMIHGLQNDNAGAIAKVILAKNRLTRLGYDFPVIGFSYDSNTTGAHLSKHVQRALSTGQIIAQKNGRNLTVFIEDFKSRSPKTKIRLMGHSLGSQVILSTVEHLALAHKSEIPTPLSISALRLVSPASIFCECSSTAAILSCGIIAMPASSAQIKSPALQGTPRISTVPLTSTVCMRHLPVIGVKPRHHTGQSISR